MNSLKTIYTFIKSKIVVITIASLLLLIGLNVYTYRRLQAAHQDEKILNQNLKAASDSIRIVKDKMGKDEADKFAYVAKNLEDLKKTNADLAKDVANTKGLVKQIQEIGFVIKHDTVEIHSEASRNDSIVTIKANEDKEFSTLNYRRLGFTSFYNLNTGLSRTLLTQDELGMGLITGVKKIGGAYSIFVKTDYPNVTFTKLDGAIIDPSVFNPAKPKRKITLGIGIGLVPVTYDWTNTRLDVNLHRVGATIGLNYNF